MKRILVIASFLLVAHVCHAQGFDKEMVQAGKNFHKNSKRACKGPANDPKKISTWGSMRSGKKNRARRKGSHARG